MPSLHGEVSPHPSSSSSSLSYDLTHLPFEIIRHILSFVSLVFPNDFLSSEMNMFLERKNHFSSLQDDDMTLVFSQILVEKEMKSLLRIQNYFGRFPAHDESLLDQSKQFHEESLLDQSESSLLEDHQKDRFDSSSLNHHDGLPSWYSAFLVFPSLIFNANLTLWKKKNEDEEFYSISTPTSLEMSDFSMIFFSRVLSCFHKLIFHTAIPFEDVLIQFDEDSDLAFNLWSDMMWKMSCDHDLIHFNEEIESSSGSSRKNNILNLYSPKLRLHLQFTNKYLDRSIMDHVLEKLLDSNRNHFLLKNGCLLKSLTLPTCSRFREGMIEEYRNYFLDTVDEGL
ncbi:hypothetical protein FDP41_003693 [Naegleria fowleri]|uniref:Uncharacterized protein n=1 Tax=Naegleria fowleri TaxID=5763 RepID=A0A6A5BTF7_NAEFO|nr:uncharacterized protein FDP41_003693 [Naegleria fowleri]KAF0977040.1 hypothetical protein FDP41_003693 [Naegleria fowleri]